MKKLKKISTLFCAICLVVSCEKENSEVAINENAQTFSEDEMSQFVVDWFTSSEGIDERDLQYQNFTDEELERFDNLSIEYAMNDLDQTVNTNLSSKQFTNVVSSYKEYFRRLREQAKTEYNTPFNKLNPENTASLIRDLNINDLQADLVSVEIGVGSISDLEKEESNLAARGACPVRSFGPRNVANHSNGSLKGAALNKIAYVATPDEPNDCDYQLEFHYHRWLNHLRPLNNATNRAFNHFGTLSRRHVGKGTYALMGNGVKFVYFFGNVFKHCSSKAHDSSIHG